MKSMLVTLEVSQLRGWLKAVAYCRGSQAGHTVRGGLRAGRGDRRRGACSVDGRARDCRLWGPGRGEQRTMNICLMSVTREVSQLEMSALKLRKQQESS